MSDFYLNLEQEFTKYLNSINRKLVEFSAKPENADSTISDIQFELREAEKCIKQMEIEVMTLPDPSRKEFNQKNRRNKADYEGVKKTFMRLEENYLEQKEKNNLMGGSRFEVEETKQRGGSLVDAQNRKLENAKKTGYTTLDIASNTNQELYRQTEVLNRNKDRLKQINSDLSDSNSLINSMQLKIRKNKLVLWGVIAVVALAFILIISSYF